jgi:hypothetical protein
LVASKKDQSASIPRTAAWAFSAWMAFWVPVILWAYGPQNFLWLCNLAQFLILYALWSDNRLLLSSQAGVVCLVGAVWTSDLLVALATGGRSAVFTHYMFNPELSLLARLASLYHTGLPIFVLWLLRRSGYDHRGPWLQCGIGAVVIVAGWRLTEPHRNINWVHAPFNIEQEWMSPTIYVALLLLLYPVLLYWPGHWLVTAVLRRLGRHAPARGTSNRDRS